MEKEAEKKLRVAIKDVSWKQWKEARDAAQATYRHFLDVRERIGLTDAEQPLQPILNAGTIAM